MFLNLNGNTSGTSSTVKSFEDSDFINTISIFATYPSVITGIGPNAQSPVNGRIFNLTTTATIRNNLQLKPNYSGVLMNPIRTPVWNSSNSGIAIIDQAGFVTQTGNGACRFICQTSNPIFLAPFDYTFNTQGGATVYTFSGWQSTSPVSLPYHMNTGIDLLISGAGTFSSSKQNIYSSVNDASGIYIRNTGIWTKNIDLTAIPAWSSYANNEFLGALITPTDMVVAYHVLGGFNSGTQLKFVDNSNNIYSSTAISSKQINNGDLALVHLNWNNGLIPTGIKFMSILPSGYQSYCPDHALNFFPIIGTNQFRQVFVQDSSQPTSSNSSFSAGLFLHYPSVEINRAPWTLNVIGGDSSNPIMSIINGSPVLICCNYGPNQGPSVADNILALNSGLSSLGSSYTVTLANLTSPINFPTY